MYDVVIKNVRCFPDKQIVPIKPITILVGENSSGKSTFLASTRLAWDIFHGKRQFDFNEDPFVLGSFDQIATYRGGKAGRAREFHVGLHIETKKETVIVSGCFASDEGKPKLSEWLFEADKYHVKATLGTQRPQTILISTPSGQSEITEAHRLAAFSYGMPDFFEILKIGRASCRERG